MATERQLERQTEPPTATVQAAAVQLTTVQLTTVQRAGAGKPGSAPRS